MKIIRNKDKLSKFLYHEKNLGFVPTMGALHQGHISLIKKSIEFCEKTVVTIFVNKPQFHRKNDYQKYPRILKKDLIILKRLKVNYLYLPYDYEIYPNGPNKNIKINSFSKKLCGKFRPNHFNAVVDVVDRFIKIIKPRKIFLGEKDMQQLKIIDCYVKKFYKNIKIVPCKTIREKNGVAVSSRNILLTLKQKKTASKIYKLLIRSKKNLILKKDNLKFIKKKIKKIGASKIDYIEVLDINQIIKPYSKFKNYKIFIAYYLNSTRLIDNI